MSGRRQGRTPERRARHVTILRQVPVDSPVHRLWAGTKLVAAAGISFTLSYFPSWSAIGLIVSFLLGAVLIARIPSGAWPRPPGWFWLMMLVTGGLASLPGGSPHLTVGGVLLGFGALDAFVRFVAIGVVLLLAAALVGWTTPLADMAPAVAQLLGPLRRLRVPVDEAAVTLSLCIRSLPLMVGEIRTLMAARKLRPKLRSEDLGLLERWVEDLVDVLVAVLAVAVRRAGELAEAITARGGTGLIAAEVGQPGPRDLAVLVAVAAVCVIAAVLPA